VVARVLLGATPVIAPGRPSARLVPLYVAYGTLQALDAHSTHAARRSGKTREANPLLRDVAHNPAALIAVKAASGVVVISTTRLRGVRRCGAACAHLAPCRTPSHPAAPRPHFISPGRFAGCTYR
jgi:hypothetical protein